MLKNKFVFFSPNFSQIYWILLLLLLAHLACVCVVQKPCFNFYWNALLIIITTTCSKFGLTVSEFKSNPALLMQHCVINIDIIIRFKLRNCEEKLLKMNSEKKLRQSEKMLLLRIVKYVKSSNRNNEATFIFCRETTAFRRSELFHSLYLTLLSFKAELPHPVSSAIWIIKMQLEIVCSNEG